MNEISHASLLPAAAISPELGNSTSCSGTPRLSAAAFASSTVTPRSLPVAGSRVAQKGEGAGPTPIATRSDPLGAISPTPSALASEAAIIRLRTIPAKRPDGMLLLRDRNLALV